MCLIVLCERSWVFTGQFLNTYVSSRPFFTKHICIFYVFCMCLWIFRFLQVFSASQLLEKWSFLRPGTMSEEATQVAEGQVMPEADEKPKVTCFRCRLEYDLEACIAKNKNWVCKDCHATHTTMTRNGVNPDKTLSEEGLLNFYTRSKEERTQHQGEKLSYKKTRAFMKEELLTQTKRVFTQKLSGQYKPLSMWKQEGCSAEELERIEATCEWKPDPVFGKVYKVTLASEVVERVQEEVERKLVELETAFKRKKLPAGTPRLALQDGTAQETAVEETAYQDLESDEEEPVPVQGGKGKGKDPAAKAAAQAAREEAKRAKKNFKQLGALLGRSLSTLTGVAQKLGKLEQDLEGPGLEGLPEATREELLELSGRLPQMQNRGQDVLQQTAAGHTTWQGQLPLDFTAADIAEAIKNGNQLIRTLQTRKRELRDTGANGKAKAESGPNKRARK